MIYLLDELNPGQGSKAGVAVEASFLMVERVKASLGLDLVVFHIPKFNWHFQNDAFWGQVFDLLVDGRRGGIEPKTF